MSYETTSIFFQISNLTIIAAAVASRRFLDGNNLYATFFKVL